MPEFTVEILVFVTARSRLDAEVIGERAREQIRWQPKYAGGTVENVVVSDVRADEEDAA